MALADVELHVVHVVALAVDLLPAPEARLAVEVLLDLGLVVDDPVVLGEQQARAAREHAAGEHRADGVDIKLRRMARRRLRRDEGGGDGERRDGEELGHVH